MMGDAETCRPSSPLVGWPRAANAGVPPPRAPAKHAAAITATAPHILFDIPSLPIRRSRPRWRDSLPLIWLARRAANPVYLLPGFDAGNGLKPLGPYASSFC